MASGDLPDDRTVGQEKDAANCGCRPGRTIEGHKTPGEQADAGRTKRGGGKYSNPGYPDDSICRDQPDDSADRPKANCQRRQDNSGKRRVEAAALRREPDNAAGEQDELKHRHDQWPGFPAWDERTAAIEFKSGQERSGRIVRPCDKRVSRRRPLMRLTKKK